MADASLAQNPSLQTQPPATPSFEFEGLCETDAKPKAKKWLWLFTAFAVGVPLLLIAIALGNIADPEGLFGLLFVALPVGAVICVALLVIRYIVYRSRFKKFKAECLASTAANPQAVQQVAQEVQAQKAHESSLSHKMGEQAKRQFWKDTGKFLASGLR